MLKIAKKIKINKNDLRVNKKDRLFITHVRYGGYYIL